MTGTAEIDFAAEGLLDGLGSSDEREARLDLLKELADAGVSLAELRRAVADDRLAALPVELVFTRECRYTLRDMIAETGLTEDFVRRNCLALGVPVPEPAEPVLNDDDLESWRMLKAVLDAGIPEETMLELGRVTGRGAAQTAEAVLENFIRTFLYPGDTERDFGLRFAQLASDLAPTLGPLTETPVRWHIRERVRREVISKTERATGRLPDTREIAVCFADLVDFTGFSERASPEQLANVTARLEGLAADVAEPPVRLTKLIGDAAMLISEEPTPLVAAARTLVEEAADDGVLPPLRAGVTRGPALSRGGDWYGRPVNLAARISAIAPASAVVASDLVAESTREAFRWSPLAERALKGIDGKVQLYRLDADG